LLSKTFKEQDSRLNLFWFGPFDILFLISLMTFYFYLIEKAFWGAAIGMLGKKSLTMVLKEI